MSLDPLTTIKKVEQFLREDISKSVSADLRSDVKAAAKLLNESVREIDQLAITLYSQCQSMVLLFERAALLLCTETDNVEMIDLSKWHTKALTEQIEYHQKVLQQFDHMLIALADAMQKRENISASFSQLLKECISLQIQFAQKKLPFQSVFKTP